MVVGSREVVKPSVRMMEEGGPRAARGEQWLTCLNRLHSCRSLIIANLDILPVPVQHPAQNVEESKQPYRSNVSGADS